MNNNGNRPNNNRPNQPHGFNPQNARSNMNRQIPPQYSESNYPPVRHKSRRQAKRAIGLVFLTMIILVMLLISVIIFAARCANGDIGGSDSTSDITTPEENLSTSDNDPPTDTTDKPDTTDTTAEDTTSLEALYDYIELADTEIHKGYLILVNYQNEFTFDSGVQIQTFYGNRNSSYKIRDTLVSIDKHAMEMFNEMMIAFEADTGKHDILINSAFRNYEEQDAIYSKRVDQYGEEYAQKYVAVPGYSEHHTALAVDLVVYTDEYEAITFENAPEYPNWLTSNGHKFGYIQRYPEDKTEITKIAYEDWHYRYVGKPHAYFMNKNNLCLEEYIDLVRRYLFKGQHLTFTDDEGSEWDIYFVPGGITGTTQVPVPKYQEYEISGNNVDGYIVTVKVL